MTLLIILTVAAALQPRQNRTLCASFYVAGAWIIYGLDRGVLYCYSAGVVSLAVIFLLSKINPVPKLAVRLQCYSLASIALHGATCLFLPLNIHTSAMAALNILVIADLCRRGEADVGGGTTSGDGVVLPVLTDPCDLVHREHGGPV